ncbi:hypothetical protein C9374_004778 [Naegleria lovaniensis]|uniref:Uncharacterized protein n=1 Tax=Naegleria lovaniensis TaxID=51637 RepID=A0AA88GPC0_NAELO|nr:uncharacterized protein C9374_004778 [Naegleria lovaniensis]KAG2382811.1 hypothetical protein C9374_004778 [Naegleria lovaniensis]
MQFSSMDLATLTIAILIVDFFVNLIIFQFMKSNARFRNYFFHLNAIGFSGIYYGHLLYQYLVFNVFEFFTLMDVAHLILNMFIGDFLGHATGALSGCVVYWMVYHLQHRVRLYQFNSFGILFIILFGIFKQLPNICNSFCTLLYRIWNDLFTSVQRTTSTRINIPSNNHSSTSQNSSSFQSPIHSNTNNNYENRSNENTSSQDRSTRDHTNRPSLNRLRNENSSLLNQRPQLRIRNQNENSTANRNERNGHSIQNGRILPTLRQRNVRPGTTSRVTSDRPSTIPQASCSSTTSSQTIPSNDNSIVLEQPSSSANANNIQQELRNRWKNVRYDKVEKFRQGVKRKFTSTLSGSRKKKK